MSADAFFDTNVLVYAVTPNDRRFAAAWGVLEAGGTVSVQVLNEFAHVAHRKLKHPWPAIIQALADFREIFPPPAPITIGTHEAALDVMSQGGFAFYDALIVAAALAGGCSTLWTEDMQDGRVIDGRLTIRNPFRVAYPSRADANP